MADIKPRLPIRRFDVFADYHFLKNEESGMPADVAKGRAIWAAKVVAGRRFGGGAPPAPKSEKERDAAKKAQPEEEEEGFRSLGGVLQTDETFGKDIISRMGQEFYEQVFHPAIEQAVKDGKRYEDIRDTIRKDWK